MDCFALKISMKSWVKKQTTNKERTKTKKAKLLNWHVRNSNNFTHSPRLKYPPKNPGLHSWEKKDQFYQCESLWLIEIKLVPFLGNTCHHTLCCLLIDCSNMCFDNSENISWLKWRCWVIWAVRVNIRACPNAIVVEVMWSDIMLVNECWVAWNHVKSQIFSHENLGKSPQIDSTKNNLLCWFDSKIRLTSSCKYCCLFVQCCKKKKRVNDKK